MEVPKDDTNFAAKKQKGDLEFAELIIKYGFLFDFLFDSNRFIDLTPASDFIHH